MSERYNALTVALDHDIRAEDAASLIAVIRQLRGVQEVSPHVADIRDWTAQQRVRRDLGQKLLDILYPKNP